MIDLIALAETLASLPLSEAQRLRSIMLERMNIDLILAPLHISEVREIQFYNPDNLFPQDPNATSQTNESET